MSRRKTRVQNGKEKGRLLQVPSFFLSSLHSVRACKYVPHFPPLLESTTQVTFGWTPHNSARLLTTGGKREFGCQRLENTKIKIIYKRMASALPGKQ